MRTIIALLILILFLIVALSFIGCSKIPVESLTEPHPSDWTVIWCDNKYITFENCEGEIWKKRNWNQEKRFVGDRLILDTIYRYNIYNNY